MSNPMQDAERRAASLPSQEGIEEDREVGFLPRELDIGEEISLPGSEPITPSPQGIRAEDF